LNRYVTRQAHDFPAVIDTFLWSQALNLLALRYFSALLLCLNKTGLTSLLIGPERNLVPAVGKKTSGQVMTTESQWHELSMLAGKCQPGN